MPWLSGFFCLLPCAVSAGARELAVFSPKDHEVLSSTATSVRVAWEPAGDAFAYHIRVQEKPLNAFRDPRNNCSDYYLCLNFWEGTEIELTVRPGREYLIWGQSIHPGMRPGEEFNTHLSVSGQAAPEPEPRLDLDSAWERAQDQMRRADDIAERLRALRSRYGEEDRRSLSDERQALRFNLAFHLEAVNRMRAQLEVAPSKRDLDSAVVRDLRIQRVEHWLKESGFFVTLDDQAWDHPGKSRLDAAARQGPAPMAADSREVVPDPPAIVAPREGQVFPSTTTAVRLEFEAGLGAFSYAVRMTDGAGWARDPRNDCAEDLYYLCLNGTTDTALEVPVRSGRSYRLWVHSLSRTTRHWSAERVVDFSVARSAGFSLTPSLLALLERVRYLPHAARATWTAVRSRDQPVLVSPRPNEIYPSTATAARLAWEPVPGAWAYNLRVEDVTEPEARDERDNCVPHYLCVDYWNAHEIQLPIRRGHSYQFWIFPSFPGGRFGSVSARSFEVAGPPSPEPPRREPDLPEIEARINRRMREGDALLLRLERLRRRYGSGRRRLEMERASLWQLINFQGDRLAELSRELERRFGRLGEAVALLPAVEGWRRQAKLKLELDETAWERSGLKAGGLWKAAVGACLLAGAAWAWRRRRRAKRVPLAAPAAARPSHSPDTQGRLLNGCYEVQRELGRGGMGVVYKAMDLNLKRTVAIKRMNLEAEQEGLGHELFLKEAQLVASLKHPNIVQIFDMFEEGGRVFLVFEYIEGRTLHKESRIPLERAKKILAHVGAALDYAHSRKVIHRDLKPSNIMLGADGLVKVMDFGIARLARHTVTQTQGWGTPAYMAPEQELGTVSRESDLYALGVCLYELVTARLPFTGPDFLGQKQRMEYSKDGLPAGLEPVIAKALSPDPGRRHHSAAELLAGLP